jgi:hypothetical protein
MVIPKIERICVPQAAKIINRAPAVMIVDLSTIL